MGLRKPSGDVETPETSHGRKPPLRLKSKGEVLVFLEPSEGWGSGGCIRARTGSPERRQWEKDSTAVSFSPQQPAHIAYWQNLIPGHLAGSSLAP